MVESGVIKFYLQKLCKLHRLFLQQFPFVFCCISFISQYSNCAKFITIEDLEMSSETFPAQTTLMTYKNLSKTGYTPIGIAGAYNAIHYGTLVIAEMYIDGN